MPMENHEEPHADSQEEMKEFSFLQETIKAEPMDKKKLVQKFMLIAGVGLVFGLFASIGFFAFKPWVESQFHGRSKVVTIPKDEEVEQGEDSKEKVEPAVPILDVNSYRELYAGLSQVASQANRSMVTVAGVRSNEGWIEGTFDAVNSVAGLIVADNGQELLILTESTILKDAEKVIVTFDDGSEHNAILKKKDENLGFAMIAVTRGSIAEESWNKIQVAALGNSNAMYKGNPVIAVGNPFGYEGGLGYGVISSNSHSMSFTDGDYRVLTTDIPVSANGTGALINLNGEVIGIIIQSGSKEENINQQVTALCISDIKKIIELLSNGRGIPYLGVKGTEVTAEVVQSQGLPQGLYVKEIVADSQGMVAGIQSGDILTSMKDTKITSISTYHNTLLECNVGEEIKLKGMRLGAEGYVDIEYKVVVGSRE